MGFYTIIFQIYFFIGLYRTGRHLVKAQIYFHVTLSHIHICTRMPNEACGNERNVDADV